MEYEEPVMEIILIAEDVVTLSNGGQGAGDSDDFGDIFG